MNLNISINEFINMIKNTNYYDYRITKAGFGKLDSLSIRKDDIFINISLRENNNIHVIFEINNDIFTETYNIDFYTIYQYLNNNYPHKYYPYNHYPDNIPKLHVLKTFKVIP